MSGQRGAPRTRSGRQGLETQARASAGAPTIRCVTSFRRSTSTPGPIALPLTDGQVMRGSAQSTTEGSTCTETCKPGCVAQKPANAAASASSRQSFAVVRQRDIGPSSRRPRAWRMPRRDLGKSPGEGSRASCPPRAHRGDAPALPFHKRLTRSAFEARGHAGRWRHGSRSIPARRPSRSRSAPRPRRRAAGKGGDVAPVHLKPQLSGAKRLADVALACQGTVEEGASNRSEGTHVRR